MNNIAKLRKVRNDAEASAERGEERPELLDSTQTLAMTFKTMARKNRDSDLLQLLKTTIITSYLNGKGMREKHTDGYKVFVPNNVSFETECPYCNGQMVLDLKEMLKVDEVIETGLTEALPFESLKAEAKRQGYNLIKMQKYVPHIRCQCGQKPSLWSTREGYQIKCEDCKKKTFVYKKQRDAWIDWNELNTGKRWIEE